MIRALVVALCLVASSAFAGTRLNMRLHQDPVGFDWQIATTFADGYILLNIMEGLVQFDNRMQVVPSLAERWDVSADRRTYTFHLKRAVKWSDGKPLTAQHFVDSWERLLNPDTAAEYAYFLFDIEGAEAYNARKLKDFSKVAIKALDQKTFQVRLKQPVGYFLSLPTFWATFPIRKDLIEAHGKAWTNPENLVVTGPFKLKAYQPQHEVTMERNDVYHGTKPHLQTVVMRIIGENSTAINLFRSKQLDFVTGLSLTELGDMVDGPDFHTAEHLKLRFLGFNTLKYPLDQPEVRHAVSMAIDRSQIPKLFRNTKVAAYSMVPKSIFPEGAETSLEFNPAKAKELLAKAGIKEPHSVLLTLVADSNEEQALFTQFLQQQLKKNLGFDVAIEMVEYRTFRSRLNIRDGSIFIRQWGADYPDPDNFLSLFLTNSGNNKSGWSNKDYDKLVTAARSEVPANRVKMYKEASEILLKQGAPVMPLSTETQLYLLNPKVQNFRITPLNYIFLKDVILH